MIIILLLLLYYHYYYCYYYYFTIIIIIIIIIVIIIIIHILTILINNCQTIFSFFRIVKNITLLPFPKIYYSITLPKLPLFQSHCLICQTNPKNYPILDLPVGMKNLTNLLHHYFSNKNTCIPMPWGFRD
jgi:hypothetical protein